jgi:hypothetical protein
MGIKWNKGLKNRVHEVFSPKCRGLFHKTILDQFLFFHSIQEMLLSLKVNNKKVKGKGVPVFN